MSLTLSELQRSFVATVLAEFNKKFNEVAQNALVGNPAGLQTLPIVQDWVNKAIQAVGAGAANITVPVAGAPAQQGNFGSLAGVASGMGPAFPQLGGNPMGSFGGQSQFPAANAVSSAEVPKNSALTRAEIGLCCVPVSQNNAGAKCGVECTRKAYPAGPVFCTKAANKAGDSGCWTCSEHVKRPTVDLEKGGGGKKSGSRAAGGAVMSAQSQVIGLRTPTGMPPGFANNVNLAGNFAGMMAQNPSNVQNPLLSQLPFAPQQTSNPLLANQLMQSVQGSLSNIPSQQNAPSGAHLNMANALNSQPSQVSIPQGGNPLLNSVQNTAFNPLQFGQQTSQSTQQGFEEDDSDSGSDDDSNAEPDSTPIPQTDPDALRKAMASFTGAAAPQPSNPITNAPNPLTQFSQSNGQATGVFGGFGGFGGAAVQTQSQQAQNPLTAQPQQTNPLAAQANPLMSQQAPQPIDINKLMQGGN